MPALWAFEVLVVNEVIKQLKVLDSIIVPDAVKVVDTLTLDKVASEVFLHDQPMFSDIVVFGFAGVSRCVYKDISGAPSPPTLPRPSCLGLGLPQTFGGAIQVRISECVILFGAKFLPASLAMVDGYFTSGLGVFISACNPSPNGKYPPAFEGTSYLLPPSNRGHRYGHTTNNTGFGGIAFIAPGCKSETAVALHRASLPRPFGRPPTHYAFSNHTCIIPHITNPVKGVPCLAV